MMVYVDEFGFEFSNPIFVVSCPPEKRGEKNREPTPSEYNTIDKDEVTIIEDSEKWNEYKIIDLKKVLKVKYSASSIHRLRGRFDKNGLPFYIVTAAPAITIV